MFRQIHCSANINTDMFHPRDIVTISLVDHLDFLFVLQHS